MTALRRLVPAIGLFLLAPLVAEFLLGNLLFTPRSHAGGHPSG